MLRSGMVAVLAIGFCAGMARADLISSLATRSGTTDLVDWGAKALGSYNSISVLSGGGITVTATLASGDIHRVDQQMTNNLWGGNFVVGEHLLWTDVGGPLTIVFSSPVSSAGAQIQTAELGTFSGTLKAFGIGNVLLGQVDFDNGLSTPDHDGSAIFIGIEDSTAANITSIQFDTPSEDFAINQVSLSAPTTAVPAPSAAYGGGALLVLRGLLSRKRRMV
jgi:hypothetical protein